ncbi:aldehyde dehydrogenase family protein [Mycobacterium xenopi 4042]|uniref:Putative succinate-semialdehyde dehydrogenase [NADP(+)] 2 n=1 Tax=Mycobacterium xenopi 4042 TaxID=1299334 RepID=X8AHP7_MYCXE|nr:aldehyde dehydrogenase family protein [Mycobacterium xenopi 4042]
MTAAREALDGQWGRLTATARGKLLWRLGEILSREAENLAGLEVRDGGKLVREMVGQMRSLPDYYFYYAGLADKLQGTVVPTDKPNYFVYTRHEPVGVVGAITPWNSPLLLLTWKVAAGLAAGCTFVVKPSEHTPPRPWRSRSCSPKRAFRPA